MIRNLKIALPKPLETENNLFLQTILARRKGVQRHEEVGKVSAVVPLVLNVEQALQRNLFRDAIVETQMMRANVDAAVGAEIVIGHLRDHRVRALLREHVQERNVAAIHNLADLKRTEERVALGQTNADIPRCLNVENDRIASIAALPSCPI